MMKQEEKELLINDIGPRLLYGVKCEVRFKDAEGYKIIDMNLKGVFTDECYFTTDDYGSKYSSDFKPYLRPMSSMTKEEEDELCKLRTLSDCNVNSDWEFCGVEIIGSHPRYSGYFSTDYSAIDWLNKNMFDYHGLIPMGLALEAKEGMYNNKTK